MIDCRERGNDVELGQLRLVRRGQMQGGARTGAERTVSYVSTGSAATTPQMAAPGQAFARKGKR